ncbi:MAG: hypothetical protein JW789_00985 [Candidatus Aenigmarchaeota archaeon]|nr:hypothetical protein [Candidatus Aenigmarchaeota archaeon]
MKTLTPEIYRAAKGAADYIENNIANCGDMVFGPSKVAELALSDVIYRGLHDNGHVSIFCDNERVRKKVSSMYPGVMIERTSQEDMKPKRSKNYTYLYVNGVDAYTDSRVVLVGSDRKTYEKETTLEGVKKMGYYAIPFLVPVDIHDRACLNYSESGMPSIGSAELTIPVEIMKRSEQDVRRYMQDLFTEEFGVKVAIKSRDIGIPVKSYPKDRSLLQLSFPASDRMGGAHVFATVENQILEHPEIKAIGIHAKKKAEILIIGDERGYEVNEVTYHPLSNNFD